MASDLPGNSLRLGKSPPSRGGMGGKMGAIRPIQTRPPLAKSALFA
jgi:hypothetical protein